MADHDGSWSDFEPDAVWGSTVKQFAVDLAARSVVVRTTATDADVISTIEIRCDGVVSLQLSLPEDAAWDYVEITAASLTVGSLGLEVGFTLWVEESEISIVCDSAVMRRLSRS